MPFLCLCLLLRFCCFLQELNRLLGSLPLAVAARPHDHNISPLLPTARRASLTDHHIGGTRHTAMDVTHWGFGFLQPCYVDIHGCFSSGARLYVQSNKKTTWMRNDCARLQRLVQCVPYGISHSVFHAGEYQVQTIGFLQSSADEPGTVWKWVFTAVTTLRHARVVTCLLVLRSLAKLYHKTRVIA